MPICDLNPGSTAVLLFFISGVVGTLAYKLMGSQTVSEGGHDRSFYHPYMEALTMSVGELICLFIYYSDLEKYKAPLEQGKTPHKFYYFLVPGFWDITLSVMQYFALNFISGSTYKMLQGGAIITTLIFSKILLSMVIEKRHLIGCALALIGLTTIGLSSLMNSSSSSDTQALLQILGIGIMVLSLVFEGYKYAYQQRLMIKHTIHQYELVGWEGFFGLIIITIVSLLFSIIPCSFTEQLCVYDSFGNPYLERFDVFFVEACTSWPLAVLVLTGTLACTVSNASGMAITKYFDGLTRCLMSMSKTALVWIIGMVVTFSVGEDPNYQLESRSVGVNLVKAAGFVFIIMGTLIYNKLIFAECLSRSEQNQVDQEEKDMKGHLLSSGREQSKI